MIAKHVDLIAIALLMVGIGIYSHMRQTITFGIVSHSPVVLHRDLRAPEIRMPQLPNLPFSRD